HAADLVAGPAVRVAAEVADGPAAQRERMDRVIEAPGGDHGAGQGITDLEDATEPVGIAWHAGGGGVRRIGVGGETGDPDTALRIGRDARQHLLRECAGWRI